MRNFIQASIFIANKTLRAKYVKYILRIIVILFNKLATTALSCEEKIAASCPRGNINSNKSTYKIIVQGCQLPDSSQGALRMHSW